ncbi:HHR089Wp [Eremothecium sinecaudum]|uniref:RNA helicase n=1 Tax=Eremothecium sinecaudum TaxID=45286 RepID=A0A109V0E4_9SACH|nr:HHR089Wp [Eremothecium sinecaudum]AMD22858.1 HHR089Wp [Eremothecium sinecaudum]
MVGRNQKNRRPGPKLKRNAKGRVSKHQFKNKASSVKESNGRIVDPSELKWKKVDIPDTLDDFGGFYGLEEIDGVDVEVVDGKVKFVTKDDSKVKATSVDQENISEIEFDEDAEMDDVIEFKNFDDIKEGELSAASESESEEMEGEDEDEDEDEGEDVYEDASEKEGEMQGEDPLKANVFTSSVDLLDLESPMLPEWTDKMELSITTLQGLANLGFATPTEIQAKAIPNALEGNDIMGKASTGSGKTLAYGIPIIEKLIKNMSGTDPVGIIFAPTRELAHQVKTHLEKLASLLVKKNPYIIISLTGGLSIQKQQRLLSYKGSARIVVATPGRFLELLEKNEELIKRFAQTETLVLDEADRLLQDGHFDDFEKIYKHLWKARKSNKKHSDGWQTMIFSATFSTDLFNKLASNSWKNSTASTENEIETVLKHLMTKLQFRSKPIIIDTNPEQKVRSQIKESLIECMPAERDLYVYYFVTLYSRTTLVFCNAIESVKKLTLYLNNLGISAFQIHSSMLQKNRLKSLEKFQEQVLKNEPQGKPTVLIASDVAARGLDIPGINHVIHYHLPRSADVYIHRSGRTARADNEGVSVIISSPEESMGPLKKLRRVLATKSNSKKAMKWQKDLTQLPIDHDILVQLRERSKIASTLADDELATRSLNKDDNWLKNAAEELGIDVDSEDEMKDIFLAKNKTKKMNKQVGKTEAKALRHQLQALLNKPLRKDGRKSYLTGGLMNLADAIVKNKGHNKIIGFDKVDALELLKQKDVRK